MAWVPEWVVSWRGSGGAHGEVLHQLCAERAGQRGFGLYSTGTAVTMLATMALAAAGFSQSPRLVNLGGLFQRASIITGFAWLTALSGRALHRAPATCSAKPPAA